MRRVKEGTSPVLFQSGLDENCWADSVECYTYLRNVTDLFANGKMSCEIRFGQPCEGLIVPFGSLVEYHPISAKDQSRIHQFGKKVIPGLFLGYALYAGGIWKGDVLIADVEELETMDASEIYSKRLNAKEVIFPKQGEFIFPISDGRIKTLGGDQELRTSTSVRHRPIQGESNIDFLGESEGSLPQPQDSLLDAGEEWFFKCTDWYSQVSFSADSSWFSTTCFGKCVVVLVLVEDEYGLGTASGGAATSAANTVTPTLYTTPKRSVVRIEQRDLLEGEAILSQGMQLPC